MPVHNTEIADIFNRLADLLEIEDANPFRVRAYRNAARVISGMAKDIALQVAADEDLTTIPGIGTSIADKIKQIVKTGQLLQLKKEEARVPAILSTMMKIEDLGPKRVKRLYDELHIKSIKDLEKAIDKGDLRKMKGFGQKT